MLAVALLFIAESIRANVLWSSTGNTPPRHRNITLENGAPCGVGTPVTPTLMNSGKDIQLEWEEFIPQNGYFEIYFSPANDANWVLLKKIDNIVSAEDLNKTFIIHKANIQLPDVTCEACSLQIIQTVTGTVDAKYFSCADIQITGPADKTQIDPSSNQCPE